MCSIYQVWVLANLYKAKSKEKGKKKNKVQNLAVKTCGLPARVCLPTFSSYAAQTLFGPMKHFALGYTSLRSAPDAPTQQANARKRWQSACSNQMISPSHFDTRSRFYLVHRYDSGAYLAAWCGHSIGIVKLFVYTSRRTLELGARMCSVDGPQWWHQCQGVLLSLPLYLVCRRAFVLCTL